MFTLPSILAFEVVVMIIQLLNIFFLENKSELPELTPVQLKKLRQLTIVSLATKSKVCVLFWNFPISLFLMKLRRNHLSDFLFLVHTIFRTVKRIRYEKPKGTRGKVLISHSIEYPF